MTIFFKVCLFAVIIFVFNLVKAGIRYNGMVGVDEKQIITKAILEAIAITAIGTAIFIDI